MLGPPRSGKIGRDTVSPLAALVDSLPGSSVSQNFKLDKNRVQRFGYQVTISILNTFVEIEKNPALATLKRRLSLFEAGEKKNNTQGRFWSKITMTAASCFCSRKEHTLAG